MTESEKKLSSRAFSTQHLRPHEQFQAWSQIVSRVAELDRAESYKDKFDAAVTGWDLDGLSFLTWRTDPIVFHRTPDHIRDQDADHWALSFLRRGRMISDFGDHILDTGSGSLTVKRLDRPISAQACLQDYISIYIPRDECQEVAKTLDSLHCSPVNGAIGGILKNFMSALVDNISDLTSDNARSVSQTFKLLLSAAAEPTSDRLQEAEVPIAAGKLHAARQFIEANLTSPELSADSVCKSLNVSRRSLYYIFEKHGGVAKYIKSARLQACQRALTDPTDHRLVSTIAFEYGFNSMSSFSRQFKEAFGLSPRDLRETRTQRPLPGEAQRESVLNLLFGETGS